MIRRFSLLLACVLMLCTAVPALSAEKLITDEAGLDRFLAECASQKKSSFEFTCDNAYYQSLLSTSLAVFSKLSYKYGIQCTQYQYNQSKKTFYFTDVGYTDAPVWIECGDENDIVDGIRSMGRRGITDFVLAMPDSLYKNIRKNGFSLLYTLEAQGGMINYGGMQYVDDYGMVIFSDALIENDIPRFSALESLKSYLSEQLSTLPDELTFYCDKDLYRQLLTEQRRMDSDLLGIILLQNGVRTYVISKNEQAGMIHLKEFFYYQGYKIAHAALTNRYSMLSDEEFNTLINAAQIVSTIPRGSDLQTALAIHDSICSRVTYRVDYENDLNNHAIGALLYGQADCDGYSDAFYLLASLAGLNVRYIVGSSRDGGSSLFTAPGENHLWNLIMLDGTWRSVDVTWDDGIWDTQPGYIFFNIGLDIMDRLYEWLPASSEKIAERTDASARPACEYYIDTVSDFDAARDWSASHSSEPMYFIFRNAALAARVDELKTELANRLHGIRYSWNETAKILYVVRTTN